MQPFLDMEFMRGFEEGKQAGFEKKVLAYENQIEFLKTLIRGLTKEENAMKVDVRKLYEEEKDDLWFMVSDYQPMINAFGNVAVQVDDDSYQGDTFVLYDNDGRIGILFFGWGSCTGCDALQGCRNIDEVQELCDDLQRDIRWFDSKAEALKWAQEKDWETEWTWHESKGREFVQKITEYLSK